eukprot:4975397-Karenia_brevis.AAC.1
MSLMMKRVEFNEERDRFKGLSFKWYSQGSGSVALRSSFGANGASSSHGDTKSKSPPNLGD